MALSIFTDRAAPPDEARLRRALGETLPLWDGVKAHLAGLYGDQLTEEWQYASQKSGWTLALRRGGDALLQLCPRQDYFIVLFVFRETAVSAALCECLPEVVTAAIEAARPSEEGRTFQVQVHAPEDLECIRSLIALEVEK